MSIYTKSGDDGITSLVGGKWVSKDDIRIASYGSVDESQIQLINVTELLVWDISVSSEEDFLSRSTEWDKSVYFTLSNLHLTPNEKFNLILTN